MTRRSFLRLGGLTMAGFATGGTGYVGQSNTLEVTRTTVDLAGYGPDFTIALLTDVHAPQPRLDYDAVVRAVVGARPDLVLIAGDAINARGDEGLVEMYAPLAARYGAFASAGNWENYGRVSRSDLAGHYARAGVAWLDNAATDVDSLGIRIIGIDETLNGWPEWPLVSGVAPDRAAIVMHHSPASFDRLPLQPGVTALMLSGHTHGGQVAPLGVPLVLPPGCGGYVRGLYRRGRQRLYVSRGLGNSHIPFRVGARPELAMLAVHRTG